MRHMLISTTSQNRPLNAVFRTHSGPSKRRRRRAAQRRIIWTPDSHLSSRRSGRSHPYCQLSALNTPRTLPLRLKSRNGQNPVQDPLRRRQRQRRLFPRLNPYAGIRRRRGLRTRELSRQSVVRLLHAPTLSDYHAFLGRKYAGRAVSSIFK